MLNALKKEPCGCHVVAHYNERGFEVGRGEVFRYCTKHWLLYKGLDYGETEADA